MTAVAALVDLPREEKRARTLVSRHVARVSPAVRWRYSAHSNERFPLRFYASARRGQGQGAHDALVIAVELFNPADSQGDRLIVSADIMDEDGVILEESPRYEVPIPSETELSKDPARKIAAVTRQVHGAMQMIDEWLASQASTIEEALAR